MDRNRIDEKFKKIDIDSLSAVERMLISENRQKAVGLYNESLSDISAGNEDIARIKVKKAIAVDPTFKEAAGLFEMIRLKSEIPGKGKVITASRERREVDVKGILSKTAIIAGAAVIIVLIFLLGSWMVKGISGMLSYTRPANTNPVSTQNASNPPSAAATPSPTPAMSYEAYKQKLSEASALSKSGEHIKAMRIMLQIKDYAFNAADAAIVSEILNTSRRAASYASYYLGNPLVQAGNFGQAIQYIDEAIAFGGLDENTQWVEYLDAYCYYIDKQYLAAKDRFKAFQIKYPGSVYTERVNTYLTDIDKQLASAR